MDRDHWLGVELRHLAALTAIAEEGSFCGAADRLGYVQSSVSQQLARLERIVGTRLVERASGSRPVTLTPAGERLRGHAQDILTRFGAAKTDLERVGEGQAGTVRVGVFQGAASLVPPIVNEFSGRCPDVDVHFAEWSTDAPVFDGLSEGSIDLGFSYLPTTAGPFACCELLRTPRVLLVPAGSPLAGRGDTVTLAEVARLPLISRQTWRIPPQLEEQMRSARGTLDVVFRSDLHRTTQAMVGNGLGVSLLPRLGVDETDEQTAIVELDPEVPPLILGLVWHSERLPSAAAEEFGEVARTVCANLEALPAAA